MSWPMLGPASVALPLLAWYDRHRRDLPWRAPPGVRADPYAVWLSEIMLQQTTVPAAAPYFRAFLARWPTVAELAAAPLDDVLTAWAGLGYYARARNLHACAKAVTERHSGFFPDSEAVLLDLPGIGAYTAAAVAAIAFGRTATVVDGNVERVVARLFAVVEPLPGVKPRLRDLAATLTPNERPGDYAQAMMDLGATVCVPRQPRCPLCPLAAVCAARASGIAETLPARIAKADKPLRRGIAFWLVNEQGEVLLRRRPMTGLLGGMTEVPTTAWVEGPFPVNVSVPVETAWHPLPGAVRHTFSHFHLELAVWTGSAAGGPAGEGFWVPLPSLGDQALPSVMRKVARFALDGGEVRARGRKAKA
jgi:A/G-specific adenine glycosylase